MTPQMSMIKISIIVAVYNAEKYLRRCLDSILGQSFKDWECLLIDDGSTDASPALCDSYAAADGRFRAFHKPNGGVGSARQTGLENAKGEYVAHIDSDDWVEPDMLEQLYAKAKETGADVVICDLYYDDSKGCHRAVQKPSGPDAASALRDLYTGFGGPVNKFVKRECYGRYRVNFQDGIRCGEDIISFIALFSNPVSIAYLPKAFYHYDKCINGESTTNLMTLEGYRRQEAGIDAMMDITSPQNMPLLVNGRLQRLAYQALKVKDYDKQAYRARFRLLKDVDILRKGDGSLHQRLILWCSLHLSYRMAVWAAQYVQKHLRNQ